MKLCKYYCVRWLGVTFPDRALTANASVSSFGETDIARKYLFGRLRQHSYVHSIEYKKNKQLGRQVTFRVKQAASDKESN